MNRIDHIVVLMLENRSFDHVLGALAFEDNRVNGLSSLMTNPDTAGEDIRVHQASPQPTDPSPRHDLLGVLSQLEGKNRGFVKDYESLVGEGDPRRGDVMAYYTAKDLAVTYALAREYAVSDEWFCSVPAETWPNRLFAHAGTSQGHVRTGDSPLLYEMDTVQDRLAHAGFRWNVYCDQFPQIATIRHHGAQWLEHFAHLNSNFRSLHQFEDDCRADRLPDYAFIEPTYVGGGEDDDHAPSDVSKGDALLRRVFLALRTSAAWSSSLLIVTFDEHGGFFDHVPPPENVPSPDQHLGPDGFDFRRLGPRVPTLLVSPYFSKGSLARPKPGRFFDHTSLIASLAVRFELPTLTRRDAAADDVWHCLDLDEPRTDDGHLIGELADWHLPPDGAAGRLSIERRLSLAAPIAPTVGKSGREIAMALAGLVTGPPTLAIGQAQLSDLQRDMCQLAADLLADDQAPQPMPIRMPEAGPLPA